MNKEQQIIEIKECIDAVYGADCAYYDVDGFAIANEIYNADYRKQEWISVKDRLPNHEERCLIFTKIHFVPDHVDECDYYDGVEVCTFYKDFGFLSNNGMYATHWMPLPEPPETKGETE